MVPTGARNSMMFHRFFLTPMELMDKKSNTRWSPKNLISKSNVNHVPQKKTNKWQWKTTIFNMLVMASLVTGNGKLSWQWKNQNNMYLLLKSGDFPASNVSFAGFCKSIVTSIGGVFSSWVFLQYDSDYYAPLIVGWSSPYPVSDSSGILNIMTNHKKSTPKKRQLEGTKMEGL